LREEFNFRFARSGHTAAPPHSWARITPIWNQVLPTRCVAITVTNASAKNPAVTDAAQHFVRVQKPADFLSRSAAPFVDPQASSIELRERAVGQREISASISTLTPRRSLPGTNLLKVAYHDML